MVCERDKVSSLHPADNSRIHTHLSCAVESVYPRCCFASTRLGRAEVTLRPFRKTKAGSLAEDCIVTALYDFFLDKMLSWPLVCLTESDGRWKEECGELARYRGDIMVHMTLSSRITQVGTNP